MQLEKQPPLSVDDLMLLLLKLLLIPNKEWGVTDAQIWRHAAKPPDVKKFVPRACWSRLYVSLLEENRCSKLSTAYS